MTTDEIRNKYNDPLNLSNVREILKISKVSATWLLQSGYVKCEISGEKMHKYSVAIDDLIEYIEKTESGALIVPFPKRKHNSDKFDDIVDNDVFPKNPPAELKAWLELEWKALDDMLPRLKVVEITGFSERTLKSWGASDKIKSYTGKGAVTVNDTAVSKMVFIKKSSLIDYLCSTEGFKNLKRLNDNPLSSAKTADELRQNLNSAWNDLEDNLTYSEVVKLTDYSLTNVKSLATQKKVDSFIAPGTIKTKSVTVTNMVYITKSSLIDYLCGEGYYTKQKPQKFKDLLKKYFNK